MKSVVLIYVFLFVCLLKMHATQPQSKIQQQQPKDCVKHPQIIKSQVVEKPKVISEKVVKSAPSLKNNTSIPHFSVFNFINFFYSKDTLDNLQVM